MKSQIFNIFVAVCLFFSLSSSGYGVDEPRQSPKDKPEGRDAPLWDKGHDQKSVKVPVIRTIRKGLLRIGNVTIHKNEGFVSMKGEVNMNEGLVEYLACGPRGKLHESVLKLDIEPHYLQIALLLIGLEPGKKPLRRQGDPAIPEGDPVEIWVTWMSKDKKMIKHRAEDLILNKKTNTPMKKTQWVFTGSQIIRGRFMAGVEHSIVATYHDPYALLDHTLPAGADDTLYFANPDVVP
ncbi:MAG: YdjY domain-containing protein, partial [Thermodesulfobacteriota bacterium]|nr:YdjY domain-containing protein [Thermodesulfobacteriota bacterium]